MASRTVYLTGHKTLGNRGCEAILRSTTALFRERFGDVHFLVPSDDVEYDRSMWPDASKDGITFVPFFFPWYHRRIWMRLERLPFSFFRRGRWPLRFPRELSEQLASVDAIFSVGGDNFSLDYGIPSIFLGVERHGMKRGTPVVLWGASVGPFEREPAVIPEIRRHLGRNRLVVVRETLSEAYVRDTLGLSNVLRAADPAFSLSTSPVKQTWLRQDSERGLVGFNISPLIGRYQSGANSLLDEMERFVRAVVSDMGHSVLMIPHVMSPAADARTDDWHFMRQLEERLVDLNERVALVERGLNASRTKHIIGQCRFFVGARTHSTIAALSGEVPTISIGYSVKARGINHDIFGHLRYVVDAPGLSADQLIEKVKLLTSDEETIRATLATRVPELQRETATAVKAVGEALAWTNADETLAPSSSGSGR